MKRTRESAARLTLIPEESFKSGTIPSLINLKRGVVIIGRGTRTVPADIMLSIKAVDGKEIISRSHAEIVGDVDGIFTIRDLGSTNGVFVNGCKIDKQKLSEGDIVQFGGVAKVPVGKMLKQSAEHARYTFSFSHNSPIHDTDKTTSIPDKSNPKKPRMSTTPNMIHPSPTPKEIVKCPMDRTIRGGDKGEGEYPLQHQYNTLLTAYKETQNELHTLRSTLATSQQTFPTPPSRSGNNPPPSPKIPPLPPSHAPAACMIDYSALQDMVKCSICHLTLLDAAVCRCSHGFCRACIETHLRDKGFFCPVCRRDQAPSSSRRGRFYFRSENLDSIVYLLHQASSQEDAAAFAVREKRHFELLRKYGIDPLQSAGSDADDETVASQPSRPSRHSPRPGAHSSKPSLLVCDYCGEDGHRHSRCPHDDANTSRRGLSNGFGSSNSRGGRGNRTRFGNYGHDDNDEEASDNSEDI